MGNEFRILTVCTGNVCRSPAAEVLLRRGLGRGVSVGSAGTHALLDRPIDPGMAATLALMGVVDVDFWARDLVPELVARADLVLAMSREHRSAVVTMVPAAVRRTFTLTEFATLLAEWEEEGRTRPFHTVRVPDRLREFMVVAPRRRGTIRLSPADYDVPDPFRLEPEAYRDSAERIAAAVGTIVGCLDGTGPVQSPHRGVPLAREPEQGSENGLRRFLRRLLS